MADVDVVIVGGGVMGAATARSLARAGREVVMLERFRIGHDRGSSHGRARIFRLSYGDHHYVRMARDALPLWRELEAETGPLLTTTGGLDLGPTERVEAHAHAMTSVGVPVEVLSGAEAMERFPSVSIRPGETAVFQGDSGVIDADRAWHAFASSARSAGATVREESPVLSLGHSGDSAEVRLEDETITAPIAVITAGAWSRELLAGIGYELETRPTRETVSYHPLRTEVPIVIEWRAPALYALAAGGLLKAAEHHAGPETDPDQTGSPDDASIERTSAWVRERFPDADPQHATAETCLYTNTVNEHFVLSRQGPFVVGSACSGHGFKFAPLIGELLGELASLRES